LHISNFDGYFCLECGVNIKDTLDFKHSKKYKMVSINNLSSRNEELDEFQQ